MVTSKEKKGLQKVGEQSLTILAAVGCYGAYVVALTAGLGAFLPTAAAFVVSLVTLGLLAVCFSPLGRRHHLAIDDSEAADRTSTTDRGEQVQAA